MVSPDRRTHPAAWAFTFIAAAMTWAYVAAWTVPRAVSPGIADYWFFTGVAERLRAGDTLYVDVWDNKDPLIFHTLAFARTWGAAGAWVLEVLWVLLVAFALYAISRRAGLRSQTAVACAFVAGPLITLGYFYFMGTTHLPGIALSLLAMALAGRQRAVWAGIALGLLVFFKLIMLPAAAAGVLIMLMSDRRRDWVRVGAGFLGAVLIVAVWLSLRGEFTGFLAAQLDNALYSQAPIVAADQNTPFRRVLQHVAVLVNPHAAAVGLASFMTLAVLWRPTRDDEWLRRLWTATSAVFIVSGLTLAVTGKWLPHAEILVTSSTLLVVVAAAVIARSGTGHWWKWLLMVVLTALLAGIPSPGTYTYVFTSAREEWASSNRVDDITAALTQLRPQSFAIVGLSVPRSAGLEDWTLSCKYYGQRPFHPQAVFDEMMTCLPESDVVVLTYDPAEIGNPAFPAYSQFLTDVEALMARDFTCTAQGANRICQRTAAS